MCDPVTLAIAATAVTAGSAVMSGYQGAAQARFAAAQADQNSALAKTQAQQVQQQGAVDALNKYRQIHAVEGDQTVGFASQGLDMSFGTPNAVVAGTAQMGADDVSRLRQNTMDRVNSLLIQSNNYSDSAGADRIAGNNAITSGWLKAGGTILSGASQISGGKPGGSGATTGGGKYSGGPLASDGTFG